MPQCKVVLFVVGGLRARERRVYTAESGVLEGTPVGGTRDVDTIVVPV